jgi:hypothetical protein
MKKNSGTKQLVNKSHSKLGKTTSKLNLLDTSTYKAIIEQSGIGMALFSLDGKILYMNSQALLNMGGKAEEIIGKNIKDLFDKESSKKYLKRFKKSYKNNKAIDYEDFVKLPSGEYWFLSSHKKILDKDGRFVGIQVISFDITECKNSKSHLVELENNFEAIFNKAGNAIYISRLDDGKILSVNVAFEKLFGFSKDEAVGKSILDLGVQTDSKSTKKILDQLKKDGFVRNLELSCQDKNSSSLYLSINVDLIKINDIEYALNSIMDLTEKVNIEKSLLVTKKQYERIYHSMMDGFVIVNMDGIIHDFNETFRLMLGYEVNELKNMKCSDITPKVWHGYETKILKEQILPNSYSQFYQKEYIRKDGVIINVELKTFLIKDDFGNNIAMWAIVRDITERKIAEEKLLRAASEWNITFDSSRDAIWIMDKDNRILRANRATETIFNYSKDEIIGMHCWEVVHGINSPIPECPSIQSMKSLERRKMNLQIRDKWFEIIADPIVENGIFTGAIHTVRDITEEISHLMLIQQSEQLHRALFSISPVGILLEDLNGDILDFNEAYRLQTGYERVELMGKNVRMLVPPELLPEVDVNIEKIKKGLRLDHTVSTVKKDGVKRLIELHETLVALPDKREGILVVSTDITEKNKAVEALQESEEKLRQIFETSLEGICMTDATDTILMTNPQMDKMFGYDRNELLGKKFNILVTEDEMNNYNLRQKTRRKGHSELYEMKLKRKDGIILWVMISANSMNDENGNFSGSIGMFTDVTELKATEEDMRKFYLGVENSQSSVIITNVQGNIEYVNKHFCELTGYSIKEILGKNPSILKSGDKSPQDYKEIWDTILEGKTWKGEFKNKKKNGDIFWESAVISPIKNEEGEIINFLGIKADITELKNIIHELEIAKDKAEESSRLKSSFLANVSHELRTPLIGILGFSEILAEDISDEVKKNMINIINKSGKRLLETLNLILDLSKIEANKLEINREEVNLVSLLNDAIEVFQENARRKKLYIKKEYLIREAFLSSNGIMIIHIFNNLINNAIKFTENGGVTIKLWGEGSSIFVSVTDTGIGIAKEDQELIWDEFRQVSEGFSRSFEGIGLGLSITKKFVEKLGGRIFLQSEPDKGSIFTVEFINISESTKMENKLIENEEKKPSYSELVRSVRPKLLLVEDDPIAIDYMRIILKKFYELDFVSNGVAALEKVQEEKYQVILMDINLGKGMNGLETAQNIRKIEGYSTVPIIAVTAFAMKGDKEEFISAGCSHYISKPFNKNELLNLLDMLIKTG